MLDARLNNEIQCRPTLLKILLSHFAQGLCIVCGAYVTAHIVNDVFLGGQTLSETVPQFAVLFFIICLKPVFTFIGETSANDLSLSIRQDLRRRLVHEKLLQLPENSDKEQGLDLHLLTEGVEDTDAYFSAFLPQLGMAAATAATVLAAALLFDLRSALLFTFTAPLIPVFMILIGKRAESAAETQWKTLSSLSVHFLNTLEGLPTLKLFNQTRARYQFIREKNEEFRSAALSVLKIAFLSALVLELIATLSVALIAVTVGLRLLGGGIEFLPAFFLLLIAPEFYQPLRGLGSAFHSSAASITAANEIYPRLSAPHTSSEKVSNLPLERLKTLEVKNLSFTYAGQGSPTLENISFQLTPGERIAIVGSSGAGKTTLLRALLGLCEPQQGTILVNEIPLPKVKRQDYLGQIAYVGQAPHLFSATVAQNIAIAAPDATFSDIESAARRALAHDFISALPAGYDTKIGDGGHGLSGGQIQRIACARAFLRAAPLLLLDEPTAQLDLKSEAYFTESLFSLAAGRSLIFIAHRLALAKQADRILFMERGKITACGSHAELLAACGSYNDFYHAYGGGRS